MTLITDGQALKGAKYRSGYEINTYDDGYGPLWISRNSIGINGIVRAKTWEDAYSICEDEFFPEASETLEDIKREYGFKCEHIKLVNDGTRIREATAEDYGDHGLKDGIRFESWQLRETPDAEAWSENELFNEAFGFRPNGPNERDTLKHGIYAKDLNGDYLDPLTPELLAELEITLDITTPYEVIVGNIGTVYDGTDLAEAERTFNEYVSQSKADYGRAAGESVTLMRNGEIAREHIGTVRE